MSWLVLIPITVLLAAMAYNPRRWRRLGYVERVTGRWPLPAPTPRQRVLRWAALYGQTTLEQQTSGGSWPFVPSAVHSLSKSEMTEPKELIR